MKTRIIVDSTADLTPEYKSRVNVVPLTVRFNEEEFIDGVTIDTKTFYEKLVESDVLPTTSQGTPYDFTREFEKAKQAGESAVVITISSKLSGTYQSATVAAMEYENIYIVDSGSVAMGSGILVERAVQLMDDGLDAKEIAERLEEEKKKIVIVALVDTLEYLKKGGRVSKTVAFAGTMLNIKPVLLGYAGLSDALLLKYIEDSKHIWEEGLDEVRYTTIGSVIGTHVGPGAIAVAFFKN